MENSNVMIKTNLSRSGSFEAFDAPGYEHLATMSVDDVQIGDFGMLDVTKAVSIIPTTPSMMFMNDLAPPSKGNVHWFQESVCFPEWEGPDFCPLSIYSFSVDMDIINPQDLMSRMESILNQNDTYVTYSYDSDHQNWKCLLAENGEHATKFDIYIYCNSSSNQYIVEWNRLRGFSELFVALFQNAKDLICFGFVSNGFNTNAVQNINSAPLQNGDSSLSTSPMDNKAIIESLKEWCNRDASEAMAAMIVLSKQCPEIINEISELVLNTVSSLLQMQYEWPEALLMAKTVCRHLLSVTVSGSELHQRLSMLTQDIDRQFVQQSSIQEHHADDRLSLYLPHFHANSNQISAIISAF